MHKLGINLPFIRGQYRARKIIPEHLRAILGKREFNVALGADPKEARKRSFSCLATFEEQLEAAERLYRSQQPTLSTAAKASYALEMDRDNKVRLAGIKPVFNATFDVGYVDRLRGVISGLVSDDEAEALIGYAADELIEKKLASVSSPQERRELLKVLASVRIDSFVLTRSRDEGELLDPRPQTAELHEPDPEVIVLPGRKAVDRSKDDALTLSALVEQFNLENSDVAEDTKKERLVAIRMFREFLGSDKPVRKVTDDDVIAYKNALLESPANYQQRFPGMTLPQAIRANKLREQPYPPLSKTTINAKWLMHLGTIFRWAATQKLMQTNPAQHVKVKTKGLRTTPARTPFTRDEIKHIFCQPLFNETSYGTRQWALLLALYTAARNSSELRRVELRHIYKEGGVDVIHFANASKNRHSKRMVPIHEDLLKLGFLDYVQSLKQKGDTMLFSDWEPEDKINRWVNRTFLPSIGLKRDDNDFYTLRHTMKTAMARAGVPRDIMDLICGHEDQSAGGVYIGDQTATMIETMNTGINKVKFDILSVLIKDM